MRSLLIEPDHARHGFPPYPKEPVAAMVMPPCRVYYPRYYDLTLEQRAFYVYWRQEYESRHIIPADATYRFLYAYELAQRAETAAQLAELWTELRATYARRDAITRTLSAWIVDLRLQQHQVIYDAITETMFDHSLMLDLAIAAHAAPHAHILLPLYSKRGALPTSAASALLERSSLLEKIDTSPILDAASGVTPTSLQRELFINVGEARSALVRFGPLAAKIQSYRRSASVTGAIDAIVEAMLEIIGRRAPMLALVPSADPELITIAAVPKIAGVKEAIVRRAIAALPDPHSLEGIFWSAESVWTRESILLLLLVLWVSEIKPYVEGRIAFARELRGHYQAAGEALGMHVTIGTMRQAYWSLSRGQRALWLLDPRAQDAADVRSNLTAARFTKKTQHLFAGSAARAQAIAMFSAQIAKRTHVSVKRIHELLSEITHTAPSMRI
ncbi:MAG: TerB N-terminal domain-containing protein [Candidatus Eremiobacteraeota bacterium]|nr:TerB N-terminal domain-containing protein [Candidatus Eremiobacteraeota bacterium]